MFQSFGKILHSATSEMSGFSEETSDLQDYQDQAFRVATSLGADLSLDEPVLDSSDLWLLGPTLMVTRAYHAPAAPM